MQWDSQPPLDDPVLIAAFEGWNDAGDAASSAVRYLIERCDADVFARVDPEEFFDFTCSRPHVELDEKGDRTITWATTEFYAGTLPGGHDAVFIVGPEPHLRWRTYCDTVVQAANSLNCRSAVVLGALVAEVPHNRPVHVVGSTTPTPQESEASIGLQPSTYEGPTGIVGVLTAALRTAELPTSSLWATVPAYVPSAPSPKAALALLEYTTKILDVWVPTTDLEIAAASYERQVSELVAEDEETTDYVRELERRHDADDAEPGRTLVEQVERFLRDRGN
jgi:predicted ATP-grasp superfamily ATP-dependent carboligase